MWIAALAGCSEPAPEVPDRATVGEIVPDFVLPGPDRAPVRLHDHRGDVIVLDLSGFF